MEYRIYKYVFTSILSPENKNCWVLLLKNEPFISTESAGPPLMDKPNTGSRYGLLSSLHVLEPT